MTAIDWHPNNKVLVAGSTDYKVRVFSACIKDMEDPQNESAWGNSGLLGKLFVEFPNTPNGGEFSFLFPFIKAKKKKIC